MELAKKLMFPSVNFKHLQGVYLMNRVAYYPKGILAPIGLLAVMVPVGEVTQNIWLDALSTRVCNMVKLESDPVEASNWACKELDCPPCDNPRQLGQFLVEHNLNLQTWINSSIINDEDPFSAYATADNPKALKAIQSTSLKTWVRQAKKLMTGEALESYMRSHNYG